jgi:flavin-dependent dehydrogenase
VSYDAIVVGARCAGSATALVLARAGRRVLLVDKATFPSDTMSTLFLHPAAIAWLRDAGLLDRVRASGCPAMRQVTMLIEDVALTGLASNELGVDDALSPRRTVLDKILIDAAAAAGAELREAFVFEDVVRDGDRVVGIRGHGKGNASVTERARVVIGADGMRSAVARAVGAEMLVERPPLACWYYTFYSGVPIDTGMLGFRAGVTASLWPTNAGATIAIVGWPRARWSEVKSDLDARFVAAFDEVEPALAARLRAGTREERFVGSGELATFVRRAHGPGWALVGDAAYHKDPCTAQGIANALVYGGALARAIVGADDGAALDAACATCAAARETATREIMDFTYKTSALEAVSPRTAVLLRAIQKSPEHTARFLGVHAGTVAPSAFFAPDNIARMVG